MKLLPEPSQASHRVKVGMIGLAAVVLLIAVASAILGSAARDGGKVAGTAGQPGVALNMAVANDAGTTEPLADLGVAPSASNDQSPQP